MMCPFFQFTINPNGRNKSAAKIRLKREDKVKVTLPFCIWIKVLQIILNPIKSLQNRLKRFYLLQNIVNKSVFLSAIT